ncbi:MAG: DUF998 domain-containing protein [Parcubacteria group bacterium]|nr:DUF998 domain-containing protein [Parcubacteria group bacterium]
MKNWQRDLLLAGVIAPSVLFFTILVFGWMTPGYDPAYQYISELGAVGSPVKMLTNIFGFGLTGVLTMLFAVGMFLLPSLRAAGKLAAVFFFAGGALMVLTGIFTCDAGCVNTTATGLLHNLVSDALQFSAFGLGFIIFLAEAVRVPALRWLMPFIAVMGLGSLLVHYVVIAWPIAAAYPGIIQRVSIGLAYALLMLIAAGVYRNAVGSGGDIFPRRGRFFYWTAGALLTVSIVGFASIITSALTEPYAGVPGVCKNAAECKTTCLNNYGRCSSYCANDPEAPVCEALSF